MGVAISVVVVVHDMARELPRTLETLSCPYQQAIEADDYEVVVVDNGSAVPVDVQLGERYPMRLRVARIDDAPPSPARAANLGISLADGELIGLIVDGARMASPGLLAGARQGATLATRPVVATAAFHLGRGRHMDAADAGYDQQVEDELLESVDWRKDGYELFSISVFAGSSGRGWFGPLGESSGLFMARETWTELRGLDEGFALPGGGLVNHDLYRRANELDDTTLVMLLGEGTFHQFHGGAATSGRFSWEEMEADYAQLRGQGYRPPSNEPLYVGRVPPTALEHLQYSVDRALARRAR
jgi:hypothetical protein